jgi:RNA polymerase sigma-70 factor (ECF subfamily)
VLVSARGAKMGRLIQEYLAAGGAADVVDISEASGETLLGELCTRGREAHPDFRLDEATFVAHLARCGADVSGAEGSGHVADLYLACACLQGNPGALVHARLTLRPVLTRYLSRISYAAIQLDEIEQRLWEALLVGATSGPKLVGYAGLGPLASWIGVCAQRIALMMLRHERVEARVFDEAAARDDFLSVDPELATIKEHLRGHFQRAIDASLCVMTDRERALYRLHLVDGHTLERIARAYGVSTSTIFRWLEGARQRVLAEARRLLRETLTISPDEFDSIARLIVSQLELRISQILGGDRS